MTTVYFSQCIITTLLGILHRKITNDNYSFHSFYENASMILGYLAWGVVIIPRTLQCVLLCREIFVSMIVQSDLHIGLKSYGAGVFCLGLGTIIFSSWFSGHNFMCIFYKFVPLAPIREHISEYDYKLERINTLTTFVAIFNVVFYYKYDNKRMFEDSCYMWYLALISYMLWGFVSKHFKYSISDTKAEGNKYFYTVIVSLGSVITLVVAVVVSTIIQTLLFSMFVECVDYLKVPQNTWSPDYHVLVISSCMIFLCNLVIIVSTLRVLIYLRVNRRSDVEDKHSQNTHPPNRISI